jgi:hypothetical protein
MSKKKEKSVHQRCDYKEEKKKLMGGVGLCAFF